MTNPLLKERADDTTHTDFVCNGECDRPYGCMFCAGGLWGCSVCMGLEGSMPSECPGTKMSYERAQEVYLGEIDFRNGQWVNEPSPFSTKGIMTEVDDGD
jgi:hypothetical protein